MIIIADSGSTKTDWCIIEQGKCPRRIPTKGMNPFFQSKEEISREIETALLPHIAPRMPQLDAVYFYGAGCVPDKTPLMREALSLHLNANNGIEVNSDMLAAARSLCGRHPGIACILGTGSNSCFYDGAKIVENVSPLGFILGDEGSGAVLGKLLVGNILKNQMPAGLKEKFLAQTGLTPAEIIDRVYRQPFPNRFLASLSPFLAENIHEPTVHALVLQSLKAFLERNVMQYDYQHYPVHFIGSVAFHYRDILREAAEKTGIQTGTILQSPMEGLIKYHTEKELSIH